MAHAIDVPFPPGTKLTADEVADWFELRALASRRTMKRGDLRAAIDKEDVERPDSLFEQTWVLLEERSALFGARWPLVLMGSRLSCRRHSRVSLTLYRFLCILSLGSNVSDDDRALFEDVVAGLMAPIAGRAGYRLGHPARRSQPKSFRVRVARYVEHSGLRGLEIGVAPLSDDKDLGLDAVAWRRFADHRGADLHFLAQCATGSNWDDKLGDLNLAKWTPHVNWALPPVRIFASPCVLRMPDEKWVRTVREAGWIIDRPRLVELSTHAKIAPIVMRAMTRRLADADKEWASY